MSSEMESAVQPMDYPVLAGAPLPLHSVDPAPDHAVRVRALEGQLHEHERQLAARLEAARQQGMEQGRRLAAEEQSLGQRQCMQKMVAAIEEFRAGRDAYLARVEHEVVRLALAIAERILHRESQLDPLLLAGAVRVALGQLGDSTEVHLRVPAAQLDLWTEMLRLLPGLPIRPRVIADANLNGAEAVLESQLGTIDLGVRAQLEEIEKGFFDLLEVRRDPSAGRESAPGKRG